MTTRYLYSGSAQDDSDSTWNSSTLSYTTYSALITAAAAGDIVWVAKDHSETQAAYANSKGTTTSPISFFSMIRATNVYSPATTAQFSGTTAGTDWLDTGTCNYFGLYWSIGDNFGVDQGRIEDCTLDSNSAGASLTLDGSNDNALCIRSFAITNTGTNASDINYFARESYGLDLSGCKSIAGIKSAPSRGLTLYIEGANFVGPTWIDTLIEGTDWGVSGKAIDIVGSKIPSGVDIVSDGDIVTGGNYVNLWNCDSGTTYYRTESYQKTGTIKTGTTNTRLWLDVDNAGSAVAHVMTAGTTYPPVPEAPLVGIPLTAYAEAAGTPATATFTVECLQHNASLTIKDSEIWLEATYMGTSGFPLRTFQGQTAGYATGSTVTSSSDTNWNVTTGKSKFKLSLTTDANIEQDGMWVVRVVLAGDHDVTYDPLVAVT